MKDKPYSLIYPIVLGVSYIELTLIIISASKSEMCFPQISQIFAEPLKKSAVISVICGLTNSM